MKLKENDIIISTVDISTEIRKGTKGVILSVLQKDEVFLVEFVNNCGETIGSGMDTVYFHQIIRLNSILS